MPARSARTEVHHNTLFPVYHAGLSALRYYGTRSDLENETLRIEVWDWDVGKDDLIGFAEVPAATILPPFSMTMAAASALRTTGSAKTEAPG